MKKIILMSAVLATCACSPLQQAPLVYSSKVSVGADVSATMTEQPGVSVSLGYKQVDAAYVPVAVAKVCNAAKGSGNCEDDIYKILSVVAYNDANDAKLPQHSISEAKKHVQELLALLEARDQASQTLAALVATKKQAREKLGSIKPTAAADGSENPLTEAQLADQAKFQKLAATDTGPAERELARVSADLEAYVKRPELVQLAAEIKLISATNAKQDAYSVFGSFDGKTVAGGGTDNGKPAAEASLVIGKVFSTGVASQNLTEGMKAFYQGRGNSAAVTCLQHAEKYRQDFAGYVDPNTVEGKKSLADFNIRLVDMCSKAQGTTADTPR